MPLRGAALRHVAQGLLHAALDGTGQGLPVGAAQHLALDHVTLPQVRRLARLPRPQHQQVGAAAPQSIFALDPAAAVHDALQIRLQDQLRRRLAVLLEMPQPVLGVLPVEGAERPQQLRQVQPPGAVHVPRRLLVQAALQDVAQFPRHHLGVDRVGHARRGAAVDQAQVADVVEIARLIVRLAAAQQRLHHAPHALLLQLVRQLVQMRPARQDQLLARGVDRILLDGARAVAPRLVVEARLGAQRVDQPRLAPGLGPHRGQRRRREALAGLLGVLRQQRARLRRGEVAQAHRLGGDVERAAAGHRLAGTGADAVVAQVPHPAQHDALREAGGTLLVAGAELAQHRQQGVAHQRVDLIHQQHQRRGIGQAPLDQQLLQRGVGARLLQDAGPDAARKVIAQQSGARGHAAEDGAHGARGIVARYLAHLDVDLHAAVVPGRAAVEQLAQRDQRRGLAALARRAQHEVLPGANHCQQFLGVQPLQRRNRVVIRQAHGAGRVEAAHGTCGHRRRRYFKPGPARLLHEPGLAAPE